jgi:hypothetical protein
VGWIEQYPLLNSFVKKFGMPVASAIGIVIIGALITFFITRLAMLGHYVPSHHIVTDYMFGLFWGIGIGIFLLVLPVTLEERRLLIVFWTIKCSVTLFAMLFYENHYTIDSYGYYETSLQPFYDFRVTGFGHGTDNTEALSWIMNHYMPVMDSYHALKVVYSFIGFLGSYFVYVGFSILLGRPDRKLMGLIFLFPSMIFWSSTLGKDPVNLFGIALYVYGTIGMTRYGKAEYIVPLVLGVVISAYFRSWNMIILLVPLSTLALKGIKNTSLKIVFLSSVVVAMMFSFKLFAQQFGVESASDIVAATQSVSHSWNYGGSAINAPTFTGFASMLKFAPIGMFTALFRPLPGEVMNPFGLLAGFENLFLLAFVARTIGKVRRHRERLRNPQVIWALTLIFVWSFVYAFVSIQNLGAAIRFRLQILPIMLALLYCLSNEDIDLSDRISSS